MCLGRKLNPQLISCPIDDLNITFWNIHGQNSKLIGDKFIDSEFVKELHDAHIVGLVELHTESEPTIPGFKLIKQKIRKKLYKGPKIAGGLAVFVKNEISHMVKCVPNDNNDSIWIKIKKEETKELEDIYIGTTYLSPTQTDKNDSLETFFEEASHFNESGVVFLQGDFNAHTGNSPDYIVADKCDDFFGIENMEQPILRNSEDNKAINERGNFLLDLCKTHDFLIVNGRKMGDIFGKYTSFQWNGCRVVDYVLSSRSYFDRIREFEVGNFYPWLSDHCPLYYNISLERKLNTKLEQCELLQEAPPRFIWNSTSKVKFEEFLNSDTSKHMFEELANKENMSPAKYVSCLTNHIITCATKSGLKSTKKKSFFFL